MNYLNEEQFNAYIDLKLETTRLICQRIVNSNLIPLPIEVKEQFSNVVELVTVLMIKKAQQFPYEWTSEQLLDVFNNELPNVLDQHVLVHTRDILLAYSNIIHEAFGLTNYLEISKKLAS